MRGRRIGNHKTTNQQKYLPKRLLHLLCKYLVVRPHLYKKPIEVLQHPLTVLEIEQYQRQLQQWNVAIGFFIALILYDDGFGLVHGFHHQKQHKSHNEKV